MAEKSSHRKCSVKKGVLKNFANFTGNKPLGTNGPPDKKCLNKTQDIRIPFDPF